MPGRGAVHRLSTQNGRAALLVSLLAAGRSPAGAVSAAEGMARLLGSEAVLDAGGRRSALGSVLAPEARPAFQEQYEGALVRLDRRTGWAQDVARGVPVLMRSAVF